MSPRFHWFALFAVATALILVGARAASTQSAATQSETPPRPRVREAGIEIGLFSPGPRNAITDVGGVRVGHETIVESESARTGVTVVVPHEGNVFQSKVPAAVVVGNGFGKFLGSTQVEELGRLETPIGLTNTLSVFAVADALAAYTLARKGNEHVRSVNPVVGECNDGYLNDIRAMRVERAHVLRALENATDGDVPEGSVGAGTGTRCLGWKGGIGTSSRRLPARFGEHTIGVLVQSNFGGVLRVAGAPVGRALGRHLFRETRPAKPRGGSCIVVVATDAPLDARGLKRLARRALLGIGAVGSPLAHGSGDYVVAFSTHRGVRSPYTSTAPTESRPVLRDDRLTPLFQAVREATEEAILNSLFRARTVVGRDGHRSDAIPVDRVLEICRRHGVARGR